MKRAKRRVRSKQREFESYILEIESWEPSYSFSLNWTNHFPGPYFESLWIKVSAVFLLPEKVKGRKIVVTLSGDRRTERAAAEPEQSRSEPTCVASLTIRGNQTELLAWLPHDAVWGLAGMLACNKVRYLDFHGHALYRGHADIRSMHFVQNVDLSEYVAD